ncbi:hypothetical protein QAD02_014982 [Eretmocerus hayati]|uniref:Uncharacterized protein n=1 Tax=Eretmocerus hayati TaxID=131215 RepID=A0ACC2P6H4_9HYME|nr:hypothetical protein QAD02_014982 [Eretmocerus hayati]
MDENQNVDLPLGIRQELDSNHRTYKTCCMCRNTSVQTPEKIFVTVPKAKRKLWFGQFGKPEKEKCKSKYCCQVHFNLPNDLQNYDTWLKYGGRKNLRDDVVPYIESDVNTSQILSPAEVLDVNFPLTEEYSSKGLERELHLKMMKEGISGKYTKLIIEEDPLTFIGVHKQSMFVLNLLHEVSSISIRDTYLVLKQMRTNLSFTVLGYRYHDVRSIIYCFETEIEKPSNSVHQALTWSDYKGCNTKTYLINILGDGLITYISKGAPGRCNDMAIVLNCGYLDKLTPNSRVLADRGLKEQIARLRIHVERAINRIRSFQILGIHSRVDNHLVPHVD